MRFLTVVFLCLFFHAGISAQDAEKPYTDMTLEELQSIDSKTLSRPARKLFKKALKAAKKAEKKRIKEEKRAEKARLKAERERQREAEKKRRQEHRFARNLQRSMQNSYKNSTIIRDEFESYVQVNGAIFNQDYDFWDESKFGPPANYFVTAYYTPETGKFSFLLSVSKPFHVEGVDDTYFDINQIRPEYYATVNNLWPDYFRATLKGGVERAVSPVSKNFIGCDQHCMYAEAIAIDVEFNDLVTTIAEMQNLDIKISGAREKSFILSIPIGYVIGLLQRIIELDDYAYSMLGEDVVSLVGIVNQMVATTSPK